VHKQYDYKELEHRCFAKQTRFGEVAIVPSILRGKLSISMLPEGNLCKGSDAQAKPWRTRTSS